MAETEIQSLMVLLQDTRYKMALLPFHVYNYTHIRHYSHINRKLVVANTQVMQLFCIHLSVTTTLIKKILNNFLEEFSVKF